jgi:hypothetical protein
MTVLSTTMPADAGPGSIVNASTARLVVPKATAAQHIRAHIQHGIGIRRQRIRYIEDLEDVRALKTEWVNSYTGTLQQLFSNSDIADECNDWVGKVYPEFAEVSLFVEQFYEEMDYRIQKLKNVLKRLEDMGEFIPLTINQAPPAPAAMPAAPAAAPVPAPAPAPVPQMHVPVPPVPEPLPAPSPVQMTIPTGASSAASSPMAVTVTVSQQPHVPPAPAPAPAPKPAPAAAAAAPTSPKPQKLEKLEPPETIDTDVAPPLNSGIFVVHGELQTAVNTIQAFMEDLQIQLHQIPAAPEKGKGLVNSLEKNPDASFALVLLNHDDAIALKRSAADASAGVRSGIVFQLGYFVGRLGLKRVCVLYTGGAETFVSDHGIQFLPMDNGNGWQLLLARHLKRAGIEIDLNKLF